MTDFLTHLVCSAASFLPFFTNSNNYIKRNVSSSYTLPFCVRNFALTNLGSSSRLLSRIYRERREFSTNSNPSPPPSPLAGSPHGSFTFLLVCIFKIHFSYYNYCVAYATKIHWAVMGLSVGLLRRLGCRLNSKKVSCLKTFVAHRSGIAKIKK